MSKLISLLWIGPGRGLAENGVPGAPTLDVVWVRDTNDAFALPLASYDVIVLAHDDRALQRDAIERLARHADIPPLLVLADARHAGAMRECLPVDAGRVVEIHEAEADEHAGFRVNDSCVSDVTGPANPLDRHESARLARDLVHQVRSVARSTHGRSRAPADNVTEHCVARHPGIIAASSAIRGVLDMIDRAATGDASVLLEGETGTGKEVLARAVHRVSARAQAPFIAINCAALTDSLLESELFGHLRGAFTGATSTRAGLFEAAEGGTIFLDEISETSPAMQAKLLRTLQEKEIRPVGGSVTRKIDVRIVSATNRNLRDEASKGNFREDLYYRLAVFPIAIPPLRKRTEDILPLAQHFLAVHNKNTKLPQCNLSHATASLLTSYAWPGNVRELENEMQRMIALSNPGETLAPHHLSASICETSIRAGEEVRLGETLREVVARAETHLIRGTLAENGGRRAKSARQLGITREGLYKKMKRLGIE